MNNIEELRRNGVVVRDPDSFFALLRGGLWERAVSLGAYGPLDYDELLRLGEEQSVLGLVTAGLEQVWDVPVAKKDVVPLLQRVIAVENRNSALNEFVASLFKRLQEVGIQAVLVKGQGIAQCYARPQWRAPGDVDLLLSADDYEKAKALLTPLASSVDEEEAWRKHLGITMDDWVVELHGTLRSGHHPRVNRALDQIQEELFASRSFRYWSVGGCEVPLPGADADVVFVFCHILQHFFFGGIGLRQICDWCRLLWTCQDSIDPGVLILRLRQMRLLSEWKVFAALAVEYLGMPRDAMPFYSAAPRWSRKARRLMRFVLLTGNFGHNRDTSYMDRYPYVVRKLISLWDGVKYAWKRLPIFPLDATSRFFHFLFHGTGAVMKGK